MSKTTNKIAPEVRTRAVGLFLDTKAFLAIQPVNPVDA